MWRSCIIPVQEEWKRYVCIFFQLSTGRYVCFLHVTLKLSFFVGMFCWYHTNALVYIPGTKKFMGKRRHNVCFRVRNCQEMNGMSKCKQIFVALWLALKLRFLVGEVCYALLQIRVLKTTRFGCRQQSNRQPISCLETVRTENTVSQPGIRCIYTSLLLKSILSLFQRPTVFSNSQFYAQIKILTKINH